MRVVHCSPSRPTPSPAQLQTAAYHSSHSPVYLLTQSSQLLHSTHQQTRSTVVHHVDCLIRLYTCISLLMVSVSACVPMRISYTIPPKRISTVMHHLVSVPLECYTIL